MADVEMFPATIETDCQREGLKWATRVGRRVVNSAKKKAPVDTGALRNSIEAVITPHVGGIHVTIGSDKDYAEFFHTGTGIYGPLGRPITPTTRQFLKFQVKGSKGKRRGKDAKWVFAREVAGMPAKPFLIEALVDVMGVVERLR